MNDLQIVQANPEDWPAIKRIFEEGIATGNATFTPEAPASWEEWARGKILRCCLVAKSKNRVVGWAALGVVSKRPVYSGVADINIYVERKSQGRRIGTRLLQAMIDVSERAGIWTLEARIFPENLASIRLHLNNGFRKVGVREKLGLMSCGPLQGQWRDVFLFERRSARDIRLN
jgi:L-amino acid N-acyltransferase YncA